ncbi:hypothetical protein ACXO6H_04160, partial [Lactobacillus delbrueckii subsp. bulgaricus]
LKNQPIGKIYLHKRIDSVSKSIYTLGDNVLVYRTNPRGISATVGNADRSIDSYWITELLV